MGCIGAKTTGNSGSQDQSADVQGFHKKQVFAWQKGKVIFQGIKGLHGLIEGVNGCQ
jgi:hypothetical protein